MNSFANDPSDCAMESECPSNFEKNPFLDRLRDYAKAQNAPVVAICAKTEAELSEMADEDKAMFLAEMGLALVSRFVPQLQVFFLAMPIKSALAFLVLVLYFSTILDYSLDLIEQTPATLRLLDDNWRAPTQETR